MPERESAPDRADHPDRLDRKTRPRKPNYMARRLTAVLAALAVATPIDVATGNPVGKVAGAVERLSGVEGTSSRQILENLLPQGDEAHLIGADLRLNPSQITLRTSPSTPEDGDTPNVSPITREVQLSKPAILEEGTDGDGTSYMEIGGFVGNTAVFAEINPSTLPGIQIKLDGTVEWAPADRDMNQFALTTPELSGLVTNTHFDGDSPSIGLRDESTGSVIEDAASGHIVG
jgi:hypothetical protein